VDKFKKWVADNGGAEKVARRLRYAVASIRLWQKGAQCPSGKAMVKIEHATKGQVLATDFIYFHHGKGWRK
jgi:DNA-binding transcriptional regulator YdaS (Cro superfamily)